jgi:hypothetical protein
MIQSNFKMIAFNFALRQNSLRQWILGRKNKHKAGSTEIFYSTNASRDTRS